ncbi:GGT1 [Enterospora canceri]|uniref:Glutathione hydrolase n=1 Tax=Enterospora canceri TaxID=1081671 RepID=A0A1Y1S872_9MICR|nr:GGT1 [Enterospora canceri]
MDGLLILGNFLVDLEQNIGNKTRLVSARSIFKDICKTNAPMLIKSKKQTFYKEAVNTECEIASAVGENILKKGGNAADAAIATAIAIGTVNSFSAGIGGGGFLMIKNGEDAEFIDFRETAPLAATEAYYADHPDHLRTTLKSTLVPGEIKGLHLLHKRHGRLPWAVLLEEPIEMCENGIRVSLLLSLKLQNNKEAVLNDPGFREIYTKNGKLREEGDVIYRKNLGQTLRKVAADPDTFYKGEVADRIAEFHQKNGGFITKEDLVKYEAKIRPVYKSKFKEYTVYTASLPTSGPFVALALNILQLFDLKEFYKKLNVNNEFYVFHFLIEIFKFMFMHRGDVEDPDEMKEPSEVEKLYRSEEFAADLFKKITFDRPLERKTIQHSEFKEDHGTTHMNILDSQGMAVLITTTVNLEFGSIVMDPISGIIYNNTMDDFALPSVPNAYELETPGTNRIKPGKRPFSSIAPTILESENSLLLIGAAGGTKIPTSIVSTILFFYLTNDLHKAITLPRIHDQLMPSTTFVESTFPYIITEQLKQLGHDIKVCLNIGTFTSVNGICARRTEKGFVIEAASDLRKLGHSCGL